MAQNKMSSLVAAVSQIQSTRKKLQQAQKAEGKYVSGDMDKSGGFHGEMGFSIRHVSLEADGILRWHRYDATGRHGTGSTTGNSYIRSQADLRQAIWYTDDDQDLRMLAEKRKIPWPESAVHKTGHILGFAMELKGGRIQFWAVKTDEEYEMWQNAITKHLGAASTSVKAMKMMHTAANFLNKQQFTYSDDEKKAIVEECLPHKITAHAPDILYLDLCINNVDIFTETASFVSHRCHETCVHHHHTRPTPTAARTVGARIAPLSILLISVSVQELYCQSCFPFESTCVKQGCERHQ
eukprot:m.125190 g.125190  ORF g.125190 m.125190 type:complete len:296 (+) comp17317_c0_seq9:109-996(+)